jgi:hypothetical protein
MPHTSLNTPFRATSYYIHKNIPKAEIANMP